MDLLKNILLPYWGGDVLGVNGRTAPHCECHVSALLVGPSYGTAGQVIRRADESSGRATLGQAPRKCLTAELGTARRSRKAVKSL